MLAKLACPYCGKSVGVLRKLFVYGSWYSRECPHCHQKLKVKTTLGFWGGIIYVIVLYTVLRLLKELNLYYIRTIICVLVILSYPITNLFFNDIIPGE